MFERWSAKLSKPRGDCPAMGSARGELVALHARLTHHAEEVTETDCCESLPACPLSQTRRDGRGRKDDRACIDSQIALVSLY